MAIQLKSTKNYGANRGVRIVCYGQSGAGKTTLIRTLPNPVIISAEGGLLSLAENADGTANELPYIETTTLEQVKDAYAWAASSEEAHQFDSIAIDSVSEIAEVILSTEKAGANKDPRNAYGTMQDEIGKVIRMFRDLPGKRHVYFTAKAEKAADETGKILWSPSLPGNKAGQGLPYFFDFVLAARVEKQPDGSTERALMTQSDGIWLAKSRGWKLDAWEPMDLGAVIGKITGSPSDDS
jgi:energy-coupling factor transporter ATP-binding protein EcfA2